MDVLANLGGGDKTFFIFLYFLLELGLSSV